MKTAPILVYQTNPVGVDLFVKTLSFVRVNKLTSVFYASVLLLTINCVITLSKWLWNYKPQTSGSAVNSDNVMTQFIINKRTDA